MTDSSRAPRHVVLVGLMGSGKTTVGRIVAARLGWRLSDSDAWIEASLGMTVRELREVHGTTGLWEIEARHLLEAVASPEPAVICAAASVAEDDRCLEALRDPSLLVAWLTAAPDTAAARFDDQAHRPRYGDEPAAFLAEQAARRGPRLRSVGPMELATDDRPPEELAEAIVARARAGG